MTGPTKRVQSRDGWALTRRLPAFRSLVHLLGDSATARTLFARQATVHGRTLKSDELGHHGRSQRVPFGG